MQYEPRRLLEFTKDKSLAEDIFQELDLQEFSDIFSHSSDSHDIQQKVEGSQVLVNFSLIESIRPKLICEELLHTFSLIFTYPGGVQSGGVYNSITSTILSLFSKDKLLSRPEIQLQYNGLLCLENITQINDEDSIFSSENFIQKFYKILQSSRGKMLNVSVLCLAQLFQNENFQSVFISLNLNWNPFIILDDDSPELMSHSLSCLKHLSKNNKSILPMKHFKVVKQLLRIPDSNGLFIHSMIAQIIVNNSLNYILAGFLSTEFGHVTQLIWFIVDTLNENIRAKDKEADEKFYELISPIADLCAKLTYDVNFIVEFLGVTELAPLLLLFKLDNVHLYSPCAELAANLTVEEGVRSTLIDNGLISMCCKWIESEILEAQVFTMYTLSNLCEYENFGVELAYKNIVQYMARFLESQEYGLKIAAIHAFSILSANDFFRWQSENYNIFSKMINFCEEYPEENMIRETLLGFKNYSKIEENSIAIGESGGIQWIFRLLVKFDSDSLQFDALTSLLKLSHIDQNKELVGQYGIEILFQLLDCSNLKIKDLSLAVLALVSSGIDNVDKNIFGEERIQYLVDLVQKGDRRVLSFQAATTLMNLSEREKLVQMLKKKGVISIMFDLIKKSNHKIQKTGIKGLGKFALRAYNHPELESLNSFQKIGEFLKCDDIQIVQEAIVALRSFLNSDQKYQSIASDEGFLEIFVSLLESGNRGIVFQIVVTLHSLSLTYDGRKYLAKLNILNSICNIFSKCDEIIESKLLDVLCNYAKFDEYRENIINLAGFGLFLKPILSNNTSLREKSVKCVNLICKNKQACYTVLFDGGIFALVDMLEANNIHLQRNSAACILSLCQLDEACDMLLQTGYLKQVAYWAQFKEQKVAATITAVLTSVKFFLLGDSKPTDILDDANDKIHMKSIWTFIHLGDTEWQRLAAKRIHGWVMKNDQISKQVEIIDAINQILLYSCCIEATLYAVHSVAELSKIDENIPYLMKTLETKFFFHLGSQQSYGPPVHHAVLFTILNLVEKGSENTINHVVEKKGFFPIIIGCRSFFEDVRIFSFLALFRLFQTENHQSIILENGGLQALIEFCTGHSKSSNESDASKSMWLASCTVLSTLSYHVSCLKLFSLKSSEVIMALANNLNSSEIRSHRETLRIIKNISRYSESFFRECILNEAVLQGMSQILRNPVNKTALSNGVNVCILLREAVKYSYELVEQLSQIRFRFKTLDQVLEAEIQNIPSVNYSFQLFKSITDLISGLLQINGATRLIDGKILNNMFKQMTIFDEQFENQKEENKTIKLIEKNSFWEKIEKILTSVEKFKTYETFIYNIKWLEYMFDCDSTEIRNRILEFLLNIFKTDFTKEMIIEGNAFSSIKKLFKNSKRTSEKRLIVNVIKVLTFRESIHSILINEGLFSIMDQVLQCNDDLTLSFALKAFVRLFKNPERHHLCIEHNLIPKFLSLFENATDKKSDNAEFIERILELMSENSEVLSIFKKYSDISVIKRIIDKNLSSQYSQEKNKDSNEGSPKEKSSLIEENMKNDWQNKDGETHNIDLEKMEPEELMEHLLDEQKAIKLPEPKFNTGSFSRESVNSSFQSSSFNTDDPYSTFYPNNSEVSVDKNTYNQLQNTLFSIIDAEESEDEESFSSNDNPTPTYSDRKSSQNSVAWTENSIENHSDERLPSADTSDSSHHSVELTGILGSNISESESSSNQDSEFSLSSTSISSHSELSESEQNVQWTVFNV
eukprot:gb/GECH01009359.1/.p1 GENE.gb/GECH01009359.1/~~gb/GECH01009359.1/.p1  ORF type:complete len:1733 (+),score=235.07 gb/GECH01009359.1/:1-5199(+)